jgi:hypothetical protein
VELLKAMDRLVAEHPPPLGRRHKQARQAEMDAPGFGPRRCLRRKTWITRWLDVHRDPGEVVAQPGSGKLDRRMARLFPIGQSRRLERSTLSTG